VGMTMTIPAIPDLRRPIAVTPTQQPPRTPSSVRHRLASAGDRIVTHTGGSARGYRVCVPKTYATR
jgi:hypothetical protein